MRKLGRPLFEQGVVGPGDILGGDRRAVGELRLGPQFERDPHAVGGHLDGLGEVAVADATSSADEVSRLSQTWPTVEPEPEPPGRITQG